MLHSLKDWCQMFEKAVPKILYILCLHAIFLMAWRPEKKTRCLSCPCCTRPGRTVWTGLKTMKYLRPNNRMCSTGRTLRALGKGRSRGGEMAKQVLWIFQCLGRSTLRSHWTQLSSFQALSGQSFCSRLDSLGFRKINLRPCTLVSVFVLIGSWIHWIVVWGGKKAYSECWN